MYTEISLNNLRVNKLPHIWCAGCGNGIVLGAILRAVEKSNLDKDKIDQKSYAAPCRPRGPRQALSLFR